MMSRKTYALISLLLALVILLPVMTPMASALATPPSKLGKPKAKPWDQLNIKLPKQPDFGKVDPKIYAAIESGAETVEVIIMVDWGARHKLLSVLPPGAKLLEYTSEVLQYVPLAGVELPADRKVIDELASYSWVKMIVYNERITDDALLWWKDRFHMGIDTIDIEAVKAEVRKAGITRASVTPEGLPGWAPYSFLATLRMVASTVKADYLWKLGYTGKGVVIAFVDTGINPRHPDFFFPDGRSKIIYWWSPFSMADIEDEYGHGTHVASIAAASGRGSGETWYLDFDTFTYRRWTLPPGEEIGMAPDAYIMMFKLWSLSSPEPATTYHFVAAFVEAVKKGADVISNSWGYVGHGAFVYPMYVVAEWATQCGVVVVWAAGNDGPTVGTTNWPSNSPSVISVGISFAKGWLWSTLEDKLVWWGSKGPVMLSEPYDQHGTDIIPAPSFLSPHRAKPDVIAPGYLIAAANPFFEEQNPRIEYDFDCVDAGCYDFSLSGTMYVTYSGTSMSAPVVAGVVADLLQAFPGATPAAIKAALIKGADMIDTLSGIPYKEYGFEDPALSGAGRVNAEKAYKILANSPMVEDFTIPPPYWTDSRNISLPPETYRPLEGWKILVDDITSDAASFSDWFSDLESLGADVRYLSDEWPDKQTVVIGINTVIESAHPYEPLIDRWWTITYPGAQQIRIHFEKIELNGYPAPYPFSVLAIYDETFSTITVYTGEAGPNLWVDQWVTVPGDMAYIRLVTDNSTAYGFKIDRYEVTMLKPLPLTEPYYRYLASDWTPLADELVVSNYVDHATGVEPEGADYVGSITLQDLANALLVGAECGAIKADLTDVEAYRLTCPSFVSYVKVKYVWLLVEEAFNLNYTGVTFEELRDARNATEANQFPGGDIFAAFLGNPSMDVQKSTDRVNSSMEEGFLRVSLWSDVAETRLWNGDPAEDANVYFRASGDYLTGVWNFRLTEPVVGKERGSLIRIEPMEPSSYIVITEENALVFRVFFNGDGRGGGGLTIRYFKVIGLLELPGADKPNAEFFARYDLVILPKPLYVDSDWIDSMELKRYVDEFCGRLIVIGDSSDMVPRSSEVGMPVKMNYITWPFGIHWMDIVGGGVGEIVVKDLPDPIDPTKTFGNPLFLNATKNGLTTLYFGSPLMSMRPVTRFNTTEEYLNAVANREGKILIELVSDSLYPGIVLYGQYQTFIEESYFASRAVFISDDYILSDVTYTDDVVFPDHRAFGRSLVAWMLCGPSLVEKLISVSELWFYVNIRYDKIAYNGMAWVVNVTLTTNLEEAILLEAFKFKAILNVTWVPPTDVAGSESGSNSTVTGLRLAEEQGLYMGAAGAITRYYGSDTCSWVSYLSDGEEPVEPIYFNITTVTFGLGGIAYTTLPADNLKFTITIWTNITGTFQQTYRHTRWISIVDKTPRSGPSPILTASMPEEINGMQANMIARHPGDLKWVNVTLITANVSIKKVAAEITGDVAEIADFVTFNTTTMTLMNLGDYATSEYVRVQDISAEAGQMLEQAMITLPFVGPTPVPLHDGHYPGLPSTGHIFIMVQIVIPEIEEDRTFTGEIAFYDEDTGALIGTVPVTVEAKLPKVLVLWDDGLYLDNRPAVDDPDNYDGYGVPVFTDHTWWHLPWTNLFELWRGLETLGIDLKPTGIFSLVLDGAAEQLREEYKYRPWYLKEKLYELVDKFLKYTEIYMISDNAHVRLDGPILDETLYYAGGPIHVSYTMQDALFKILNENKGTLFAAAQYYSLDLVNEILAMIGSRIQYLHEWGYNGRTSDLAYGPYWEIIRENPVTWGVTMVQYNGYPGYYLFGIYDGYNGYEAVRRPFIDSAIYTVYKLETPVESPHPYPLNYNNRWKIEVPGAGSIKVVFKYLRLAEGDEVRLLDWRLRTVTTITGPVAYDTGYTHPIAVPGDTVWVQLISDDVNVTDGFLIEEVLVAEAVPNDIPLIWMENPEWLADYYIKECTPTCSAIVYYEPDAVAEDAAPEVYGIVYAYDSMLMGVNASLTFEGAKVVAFGHPQWWDNRYMYSPSPRPNMPYHIKSFFESLFGYLAGYYDELQSLISEVESLLERVSDYINSAKERGILVPEAENLLNQAYIQLEGAKNEFKSGHFLTADKPLVKARDLALQAWEAARDSVFEFVQTAKSEAENAIASAKAWIDKVAGAGIDVSEARSLLSDAESRLSDAEEFLAEYNPDDPETWEALFSAFDVYKEIPDMAMNAKVAARNAAESAASSARSAAEAAIAEAEAEITKGINAGVDMGEAEALLETAKSALAAGDASMNAFNRLDETTWDNLLTARSKYMDAESTAKDAKAKAEELIRAAAQEAIDEAKRKIEEAKATPGANPDLISQAETKLSEAITKFGGEDYIGAIDAAKEATSKAEEAVVGATTTTTPPGGIELTWILVAVIVIIIILVLVVFLLRRRG